MIFILLVLFQIKHFICDYPLQNSYMLRKTENAGWVLPLICHAGVHAAFTFLIMFALVGINAFLFAFFDFVIHFIVDRIKSKYSKNVDIKNPKFWSLLGLDQMAHHLTHYIIIGVYYAF